MVMCAELICIGPYSKKVSNHMDYPPRYYKDTTEGVIVTRALFGIMEGSTVGAEFAWCLGITNPWDFNQHEIDNNKINIEELRGFVSRYTDYDEDLESLKVLINNGFNFHFRPNG